MTEPRNEDPPLLKTWPRLYTAVILWLAAQICLYYWFTKTWNR